MAVASVAPPSSASAAVSGRLAVAWARSIAIRGYQRTTVAHLLGSSGISRSAFYDHFGSKNEAFVSIHSEALAWFADRLGAAAAAERDWPSKVAAAIASALEELACRPCEAQLLLGDPLAAGPRMGYCQELLAARFVPALAVGRRSSPALPPPSLEVALIGGLVDVISSRLRFGKAHTLPALGPSLTEFVLLPYLGPGEARRVVRRSSDRALFRAGES